MYYFHNLAEVQQALKSFLPSQGMRIAYTTEHISSFMDYIGNPQNTIRAIHIAGTSGKTSTAHYAASLLQRTGQKIGLLTSPHVKKITERIRINLTPLSDREFCDELAIFMELVDKSKIKLTYAELLYAFGYWEFARQGVDYMVIETGLGGLLDATNVIQREDKICVITDLGLDHTNVLGNTLDKIATHKAGIITFHNAIFTYAQLPEAMRQIQAAARKQQADLHIISPKAEDSAAVKTYNDSNLPLFQQRNAWLALKVVEFAIARDKRRPLRAEAIQQAIQITIPGRMETLQTSPKVIILDGAHNVQKLQALRKSIEDKFPNHKVALLVSFLKSGGRDIDKLLKEVAAFKGHLILTVPADTSHTWYETNELENSAKQLQLPSFEVIADYSSAVRAWLARPESVLIATGSLYAHGNLSQLIPSLGK